MSAETQKPAAMDAYAFLAVELNSNEKLCPCCGQVRPYPTEPGAWEYLESPGLARAMHLNGKICRVPGWIPVDVVKSEEGEGLLCIPVGEHEPIWWPDQAMWRRRNIAD